MARGELLRKLFLSHKRGHDENFCAIALEIIAEEKGSNTVYNWVHPNNFRSIPFLKKRGYNVLNLIEVCKKRPGEKLTQKIKVGNFEFDY